MSKISDEKNPKVRLLVKSALAFARRECSAAENILPTDATSNMFANFWRVSRNDEQK